MSKTVYLCVSAFIMAGIIFSGYWFIFKDKTNLSHYSDSPVATQIDLQLKIKEKQGITYTEYEKRTATDENDKWTLSFLYSSEGINSQMNFWLDKSGTAVSDVYTAKVSSEMQSFAAYGSANGANVRLAAQNNNYSTNTYYVFGYWNPQTP